MFLENMKETSEIYRKQSVMTGYPRVPWLVWAMYFTFYKILENRSKNTRPRRSNEIMRGRVFLIYFPKSTFQSFGNWKIRGRTKFHADVYLLKIFCHQAQN